MNEKMFEQMCEELVEDYVFDEDGNKAGVVLDIDTFRDLMNELHDLSLKVMSHELDRNPNATEDDLVDICCGDDHDHDDEDDDYEDEEN